MAMSQFLTPLDLQTAIDQTLDSLSPLTGKDWSVRAGSLRWSCLRTASHMADDCLAYAGQLAAGPTDHYVEFRARLTSGADSKDAVEFIQAASSMMVATLRIVGPSAHAYHPWGLADAMAFNALAGMELYVHGWDICQGLHGKIHPDRTVCSKICARLFPLSNLPKDQDPWDGLLYLTGRTSLGPSRPQIRSGRWHPALDS